MNLQLFQVHEKLSFFEFQNVQNVKSAERKFLEPKMNLRQLVHGFEQVHFHKVYDSFRKEEFVFEGFDALNRHKRIKVQVSLKAMNPDVIDPGVWIFSVEQKVLLIVVLIELGELKRRSFYWALVAFFKKSIGFEEAGQDVDDFRVVEIQQDFIAGTAETWVSVTS